MEMIYTFTGGQGKGELIDKNESGQLLRLINGRSTVRNPNHLNIPSQTINESLGIHNLLTCSLNIQDTQNTAIVTRYLKNFHFPQPGLGCLE
jgi:hypothetical protein